MEDILKEHGYRIRSFPRARLALSAAAQNPPDLILLDINMPEMNGFELCERLKSNPELSPVPVIFLSALNETEDKVKAFRAGGADYVTKPFQVEEVRARVETHLRLHNLQRASQLHADHLEGVVRARTRELAEAHARLKILDQTKSDFLNLISHEFRTPLNGILGVAELVLSDLSPGPDGEELRDMFERSRRRILTILDDALLLTQIEVEGEKFESKSASLGSIMSAAIEQASEIAACYQVTLAPAPAGMGFIVGTEDLLVKALKALLETAVKFSRPGDAVCVTSQRISNSVQVSIAASGCVIPDPAISRFFDLFSIGEALTPNGDLGLGPALAHRILSLFGGSVSVENRDPSGIELTVSFRHAQP